MGGTGGTATGRLPSRAVRRQFLELLGMTANVSRAARELGVGTRCLYRLRLRDEAFRAAWEAALDEGLHQVEAMLLDAALGETLPEGIDRKLLLEMVTRREARLKARGGGGGGGGGGAVTRRGREVSIETVERSLLAKLAALDRQRRKREQGHVGGDATAGGADGGASGGAMAGGGAGTGSGLQAGHGRTLADLGA